MVTNTYLKKRISLIFVCSLFPFLLTVLFHNQLYAVVNVSNYLIFHNIAEFFSVVVSFSIFGVGWYAYEQTNNRHILFLSTVFFVIGWLDFFHALGYAGMPAFITPNSAGKSTQYWIAARLFMALTFLGSAFIYPNTQRLWLSKTALMIGSFVIPTLAFIGITFFPEHMPITIVEGVGLTPFKKNSECLIIVLLFISLVIYWQRILKTSEQHLIYFLSAFVVCIFSEAAFTGYKSVFDTYNVLGHIYKIVAFYLIYLGLFAVSVKNPYLELATINKQLQEEIAERIKSVLELKDYRDNLEHLVVERTLELEKAKIVAESANNAKSMFLSNMSHELRTPMNAILGLVFILKKKDLSPEDKSLLHKIHVAGQSLLGIISDVLDISKIEAGKLELEIAPFNLHHVLDNLEMIMSLNANEKNIGLFIHRPSNFPVNALRGDSLRLQQVLINLVGNAVKFVQHGRIDVSITVIEHNENNVTLHFSVADTGVGISPEVQKRIFAPFTQADNSTTRHYGGTGLGLAISRQLVELMGGTLFLVSEVGKGSEFSFNLHFDYSENENSVSEPTRINGKNEQLKRLEGYRLLIVDDNEINLEVASRIFGAEGAEIVTVDDGQKAVEWLKNHSNGIDLVLMDVQMPIMNGYEATRLIREIPELINLPVVALSAGVFKSQIEQAKSVGIVNFIAKPFDVETAINLICELVKTVPIENPAQRENKTPLFFEKPSNSEFQFPGIDVELALKIWDNTAVYQRYLLKFLIDCEAHIAAMENATTNELARLAHKITGTAGMLGLMDINNAAAELDELAQDGMNINDAIERLKQAFVTASSSITRYVAEQNIVNPILETKPFDRAVVAQLLTFVLQGIEQDSPDGLTATISKLNEYLTEEHIESLKLALDSFDFPLAKSEIIKLADEFNLALKT